VLQLDRAAALESGRITIRSEANRVPEANRGLHSELVLEGRLAQPHLWASVTHDAVLEEHRHDGSHGKTPVRQLGVELPRLLSWIRRSQKLPAIVTWSACLVVVEASLVVDEAHVGNDLCPAKRRHLGKSCQTVGHIRKLQAHGGRQVARELACDLRRQVAHAGKHADAPVLQLDRAAALESGRITIRSEANRVPEANRGLHSELVLESLQCDQAPGCCN